MDSTALAYNLKAGCMVPEKGTLVLVAPLLSTEAMQLFAQCGSIGIVYGTHPALRSSNFVNTPRPVKIDMGGLSDSVPTLDYRRKSRNMLDHLLDWHTVALLK
ncbi:hypothetical protein H310_11384 [Aphanomyces invadans]|uniref:Uncharacterized protein n=1 Tax=Aphanomyces invadans TaxID=157072 RepID=A0A024TN91_9STRA|nr:hypothetical protein H310_11384 [Aphanomyces invadans]ETV95101.1 hypothetical protein H310_11384 [Aphanomyces invadans]|eukprot:XP_008876274.1 hypothetical protein H310_11384 [Aphanomyces invadans]